MTKGPVRDGGRYRQKKVRGTSTWKAAEPPRPSWWSESIDKFRDAETLRMTESHEWDQPPLRGLETERVILRDHTIQKFKKFSSKFGSVADMMKKLNIPLDSNITLDQFTEKIKERNYDIYYSREDQRLLFEKLSRDPADGSIEVKQLVTAMGEKPVLSDTIPKDVQESSSLDNIRHKVFMQLKEKRSAHGQELDRKSIGKQVEHALFSDPASNGTVNEANLKYAFGPQGLNIQISNEDVKVLVEEANKRFHGNVNVGSFVQSLRIKDPSMDVIPLFDARESFISRLKTKIGNIDETCASPKLMGRISELTCELDTATGHVSRDISHGSKMSHSMSSGTILRPRTSSNLGTLHKSASEREFSSLAHSTKQMSLTDTNGSPVRNGRSASGTISLSPLPNCNSPATVSSSKHNSQVLYPPPDFSPTAVSNPTTVETTKKKKKPSRHRDPADIMLEELELAKTPRHEGTKRVPVPPTDWTRVGVGGNGTDTQSGLFINEQSQFLTQSMATFSEVQFAPGIGSVREGEIGDAERLFLERERKRNERYARTANNLKVTQTRLELEELNEQMTQLRRSQRSAQGMLNYSSKVFARDMKELKRQPLHCMQRKPNPKQFKFMWSGTFHPAHHVDSNSDEHSHRPMLETKDFGSILSGEESARFTTVAEDREFKTTYSNTFNREALVDNGKHTVGNMHNRPGTSIY